jgi:nitrate reductase beta subunit
VFCKLYQKPKLPSTSDKYEEADEEEYPYFELDSNQKTKVTPIIKTLNIVQNRKKQERSNDSEEKEMSPE